MRTCAQCKVEDHEILQAGGESVHFVVPEIRYFRTVATFSDSYGVSPVKWEAEQFDPKKHGAKGWTPKVFQGRPAMYRYLCVNCINENRTRDKVWGELKRDALKLEKPKNPDNDFYSLLCQ